MASADVVTVLDEPAVATVVARQVSGPLQQPVQLLAGTPHLSDHAGQISFPGGRVDPADRQLAKALGRPDDAAKVTAIRETIEETAVVPGLREPIDPALLARVPPQTKIKS